MDSNKPAGDDSFATEEDGDFAAARIREVEAMRSVQEAAGRLSAVQFLNGAEWIRSVALFTAINAALRLFGAHVRLVCGLGTADLATALGSQLALFSGGVATAVHLGTSLAVIGLFLWLSNKAGERNRWAFYLAMVLYFADGGIFLLANDLLEVACHGFVLFKMWSGLSALNKLEG